jgi:hypothetical protein
MIQTLNSSLSTLLSLTVPYLPLFFCDECGKEFQTKKEINSHINELYIVFNVIHTYYEYDCLAFMCY